MPENELGAVGCEHPANSAGNPPVLTQGGAESDATDATDAPKPQPAPVLPADLAEVLNTWPALPPAIRAGILAMVKAAKGGAA